MATYMLMTADVPIRTMAMMGTELTRDDEGHLVPVDPMYISWSERDSPSALKYGPRWAQPDIWLCRDDPGWEGEDIPESLLARFGEPTYYPDKPVAEHREIWERDSIQAHAALHGYTTVER